MKFLLTLTDAHAAFGRLLDHFRSLVLLATRLYVGWPYWRAGALKIGSLGTSLELFRAEHHAAGLTVLAFAAEASGELLCAALVLLGLFARVGALGAFCLNAALLVAYHPVGLGASEVIVRDRYTLWSFMLLVLTIFGPGRIAVDTWLERRSATRCRPATAALASE
jgi:putative oxidoreductase